jgi:hypothetical protein
MTAHNHDFTTTPRRKLQARKRRVDLDGRVFLVGKREDGTAINIMERKVREDGRFRASTYWHHSHGVPVSGRGKRLRNRKHNGSGKSIVRTVLEMAGASLNVDTRENAGH